MRIVKAMVGAALVLAASAGFAGAKDWTTVRIGIEAAYPPFNGYNANNELVGFDYDIGLALCAKMGVECSFVAQDWDGMIPALLAGKYDAIVSSMSITDERKEVVDFTDKYYTNALTFVAPKDTGITDVSPAGMAGKILGAQGSTVSAQYLEEQYGDADVKLYPTQDDAYLDLAAGRLDAVLADVGPSNLWLAGADGACCAFLGEAVVKDDLVGIAIRKEDGDLKAMFNKAITDIVADGTYKTINDKYFPFSIY
ncbi:MAG: ABC transporter substrate-binding protein [Bauldia sp.]|nr:ABC transporter substrate-binding protein [Bauldia sp.]